MSRFQSTPADAATCDQTVNSGHSRKRQTPHHAVPCGSVSLATTGRQAGSCWAMRAGAPSVRETPPRRRRLGRVRCAGRHWGGRCPMPTRLGSKRVGRRGIKRKISVPSVPSVPSVQGAGSQRNGGAGMLPLLCVSERGEQQRGLKKSPFCGACRQADSLHFSKGDQVVGEGVDLMTGRVPERPNGARSLEAADTGCGGSFNCEPRGCNTLSLVRIQPLPSQCAHWKCSNSWNVRLY